MDVVGGGPLIDTALGDVASIVTSPLSTDTPGPAVLVDALTTEPAESCKPTFATSEVHETSMVNVMLSEVRTETTEQTP